MKEIIALIRPEKTEDTKKALEAIGLGDGRNMSSIAKRLDVTVGTLTTSVNGLLRKEYVVRSRGEKDRRIVRIDMTEKGKRAYDRHNQFHEEMINAVLQDLDSRETEVLVGALTRLSRFFTETEF